MSSLLFASMNQMMDKMKNVLSSEWKVTDLGEPHKIVSIEVTHTDNSIKHGGHPNDASQCYYPATRPIESDCASVAATSLGPFFILEIIGHHAL